KDLQSDEAPRPLDRMRERVNDFEILRVARHIACRHAECPMENAGMAGQIKPRAHRRGEPFVRVERDRIGLLDSAERSAQLWDERGRPSPGGVNVKPGALP